MSEQQEFESHFIKHPAEAQAILANNRAEEIASRGSLLVQDVERFINRFVSLPPGLGLLMTLWAIATHLFSIFDCFPYLAVTSPAKRCGKTRLTEVLELLCANPVRAANMSEAALFRLVHEQQPTLFLDESERLRNKRSERAEALVGLLNAGHRQGAVTYRAVGQSHELQAFKTYSPKVIACIGTLPEMLADRSIPIAMQQRPRGERLDRFILRRVKPHAAELHMRLAEAARHCQNEIQEIYESPSFDVPDLEDREGENWAPLFAVCAVLAPDRLAELKQSALRIAAGKMELDVDNSRSLRLLTDIRTIWPDGKQVVLTIDLVKQLCELSESPWQCDFHLNERRLARMLRGYEISPRTVRDGDLRKKGYVREQLERAWERYLPPIPPSES